MWTNLLKVTFRSLWRQKLTTSITILSLAIGIACASLAYLFIQHEYAFDTFHEESEKIHWLHGSINGQFNLPSAPGALAPALEEEFVEVTESFRMETGTTVVALKNEFFKEEVLFVDPNFFEFFNFSLRMGDPATALEGLNEVVLSPTMAEKYFGRQNPIGQALKLFYQGEESVLQVSGVAEPAPTNSSIQFDFLLPIQFAHKNDETPLDNEWESFSAGTYFRLRSVDDLPAFESQLTSFMEAKFPDREPGFMKFPVYQLEDYHLSGVGMMSAEGLTAKINPAYVHTLAIIALLMLIVACLNFTNLSNARGSQRLTEIGVRQVLGASRQKLVVQFLTESVLFSLLSTVLAAGLVLVATRYLTELLDYPIQINWASTQVIVPLLLIVVGTGVLAGAYPAFLLSRLSPSTQFKSDYKIGSNNWVTKAALVFQFTLSVGLLACTYIMYQQQRFLSEKDLGFNQEQVVVIPTQIQYKDSTNTDQLLATFRAEVSQYPGVQDVSGVSYSFSRGNIGRMISDESGFDEFVFEYRVDPHYLELLDLQLLKGRNLKDSGKDRAGQSIVVNETFLEQFEVDVIGDYRLPETFGELAGASIVGVVKDYNYLDLKQAINPALLSMNPEQRFHYLLVKIKPDGISTTITQLQHSWQAIQPDKPFQFSFLDEDLQQQYVAEARWNGVISGATLLAIIIALLGLFGLVALSIAERKKEIGIRKVLGASVGAIVALFSKNFLGLVLIATLIASPIAWYAMQQWLADFAYRIEIQWWIFLLAGLVAVGIALATIGVQGVRAALAKPVDALRDE